MDLDWTRGVLVLLLLLPLLLLLQMLSRKSDPQPALLRLHS